MVSTTATHSTIDDVRYFGSARYTAVFSTNVTFTAIDFVDSENLKFAAIIKNSDGSELTNTVSNNVITCTGTCSDAECTIFVFGVRST